MSAQIIEALFSAFLGQVDVKEFEMKMENIEKFDGNIEIPAEIELD